MTIKRSRQTSATTRTAFRSGPPVSKPGYCSTALELAVPAHRDTEQPRGTGDRQTQPRSMRGGRGNDGYFGSTGDDRVSGGRGHDFLWDFLGVDLWRGGASPDCLFTDDSRGADLIVGGPGVDNWEADSTDTVIGAETEDPTHCD
jgi:hypothetical protein